MKIVFPLPPTTNSTYKTGKGNFYKSKDAQDWRVEAFAIIKMDNKHERFGTIVKVEIIFHVKEDRDIDGGIKTILDVLQEAKVLENDTQVYELLVKKRRDINKPRAEVAVFALNGMKS